ncbi:MDR family MFS transporter [Streptacidiphilus fuscans]|uniref:MFS transporter n=1 Tax=Streptacidiphilus fuscans TaxID=2789292 RepID=A0A931B6P3_9ACTN|nr:MDR family MFS transporter [Streptacidiphilus fuscans]MBF9071424.1 MFS transporter [Streptacidiphilus fuscans]
MTGSSGGSGTEGEARQDHPDRQDRQQAHVLGEGAAPPAPPGDGRRKLVVAALMLSMALVALDSACVSTAVPQIVGELGGFSYFSWMFSGYLLAVTVTLPVYGKLADARGRKPVLLIGSSIFLLGSLLCAGAWSMTALIVFRLVQGLGGGAIQGTVQTLAADLYPLEKRPRIQAAMSTVWAVSAVLGPALGGVLASYANWRWIFLINLPVGLLALALLKRNLREPQAAAVVGRSRIDWPGAVGLFLTTGLLLFALVQGGVAWPWLSAPSVGLFAASLLAGVATYGIERRAEDPIIPGWIWRRRVIVGVNLALGCLGLLMIAPMVFLPTYAQSVLGLAPVAAGFVLSVWTVSWPISAALSNRIYRRIGFRNTALIGAVVGTALLAVFPLLPYRGPAWQPALLMLLLGAGLGLFQLPLIIGVQSSVPWHERGTATASILFCRQVGQSVGGVLFAVIANATLTDRLRSAPAALHGSLPQGLDQIAGALLHPTSTLTPSGADYLRHALASAVDDVYVGAAVAAALAVLVLATVTPKRFPLAEGS